LVTLFEDQLKRGFHSNTCNVHKALRKKYASKIKSTQETQQMQENYASKKQKYASASHATDTNGSCIRKCNNRADYIFHATKVGLDNTQLVLFGE